MNILSKIFSGGATKLVEGIGGVLDNLLTSKDEKLAAELKIKQVKKENAKKYTSDDEEQAYENAQNDFDTDNPTKAQLAKALRAIKNERSNKKRSDAERALEAKEDAMGL